jgi:hypothetical protein
MKHDQIQSVPQLQKQILALLLQDHSRVQQVQNTLLLRMRRGALPELRLKREKRGRHML